MIRKLITTGAAVVLASALVGALGTGVAVAHGKGKPPKTPVTATGSTTCNFHGTLAVNKTGTLTIRGNLTPRHHTPACSSNGGAKLRAGHLSGLKSTSTISGLCSLVTGGPAPDLAGGTIRWSPKHKIAASTGVALTGGTVSVVTNGSKSLLQVAYTDGSVAAGSFTNASGAALTATSRRDTTHLAADCAKHPVHSIAINGTITL